MFEELFEYYHKREDAACSKSSVFEQRSGTNDYRVNGEVCSDARVGRRS